MEKSEKIAGTISGQQLQSKLQLLQAQFTEMQANREKAERQLDNINAALLRTSGAIEVLSGLLRELETGQEGAR
jgi:hypothetical protein